jgi:DNA (cytosine-5)-methyltransferase 1
MTLTVGSLFSGIGGFDLGLERAGMKVIWQSEIDEFASKVLKKHWPDVPNLGDITKVDWSEVERPDVICGGYPCQPFSTAGKRKGTDDPRHLWRWVRDAISELRPKYAILENVRGHLSMGGLQVVGELAEIGYDAEWRVVSAAGLGAPHRRERIIIVAHAQSVRKWGRHLTNPATLPQRSEIQFKTGRSSCIVADTDLREVGWGDRWDAADRSQVFSRRDHDRGTQSYEGWKWWEIEPDVGRVANGVPDRVDRLKGLGNAIVPQVAELVGALVVEHSQN